MVLTLCKCLKTILHTEFFFRFDLIWFFVFSPFSSVCGFVVSNFLSLCFEKRNDEKKGHCGYRDTVRSLTALNDWCAVHNGYCCFSCFEWLSLREPHRNESTRICIYMLFALSLSQHIRSFSTTRSGFLDPSVFISRETRNPTYIVHLCSTQHIQYESVFLCLVYSFKQFTYIKRWLASI